MEDNFVYQLNKILKYSLKGEFVETGQIEFTPPSMTIFDESSDFEQLCMGAMMSAAKGVDRQNTENKKDEDDDKKLPNTEEIRMLLLASQDIKFKDIAKIFRKICTKTAKLDEKTLMKDSHFDKLNIDDFRNMLCGYAAFFVFPSLMRGE